MLQNENQNKDLIRAAVWQFVDVGGLNCGGFWQRAVWLSHMWFPWQLHTYSSKGAWAGCHWQPFPHWNPSVRHNRKRCGRRKRRRRSMVVLSLSEVHQTKIIKKGIFQTWWARRRGSCSQHHPPIPAHSGFKLHSQSERGSSGSPPACFTSCLKYENLLWSQTFNRNTKKSHSLSKNRRIITDDCAWKVKNMTLVNMFSVITLIWVPWRCYSSKCTDMTSYWGKVTEWLQPVGSKGRL